MVATTRGIPTDAVVTGDGVWNLVLDQRSGSLDLPSNEASILDVLAAGSRVYADAESLEERDIGLDDIVDGVTVLPFAEVVDILLGHDAVFPYCGGF